MQNIARLCLKLTDDGGLKVGYGIASLRFSLSALLSTRETVSFFQP